MSIACPCGEDHTADKRWPLILDFVSEHGETVIITVKAGSWRVPRAWVGMHGIKADEVAGLADKYGWEIVTE